jgi:hypothetical protein
MEKQSEWLLQFKDDIHSQSGEDGIIKKILEVLQEKDRWCVEFGAWDGIYLSNTRNLIERLGYSAILIEGSERKYEALKENCAEYNNVTAINQFVGFSDKNNLDEILKDTPIPLDFDFLSIDVDGNDYHIWKAMSQYRPKLVCIEYNPTIPTEIKFIQEPDPSVNQGASLMALVELGKEKGYELVAVLPTNSFFIKSEYFPLFRIQNNSPVILRKSLDVITYLFSGYDGKMFLHGSKKLPWHGIEINESKIQQLPKFLQKYPRNYTKIEKLFFVIHKLITRPHTTVKRIICRLTNK